MTARHIALTCLLALAASGALAADLASASNQTPSQSGAAPLTREQVRAEAIRHPPASGMSPVFTGLDSFVSTRTREEVRAEAAEPARNPVVHGAYKSAKDPA